MIIGDSSTRFAAQNDLTNHIGEWEVVLDTFSMPMKNAAATRLIETIASARRDARTILGANEERGSDETH